MALSSIILNITITKLALLPGRDRAKQRKTAQARTSGPDSTANSGNFDTSTSIARMSATEYVEYPPLRQNKIHVSLKHKLQRQHTYHVSIC